MTWGSILLSSPNSALTGLIQQSYSDCMLNLKDKWHVALTPLWSHMSLTIFHGWEPRRLLKDMLVNLETEPQILWTSHFQSIEQLLFSYYQGTLLREFGRCELNCVNWRFIYLSTVHIKYYQAQEHLELNIKAISLPGTVMSSKYPTKFPKFFGKVQVWLLPHSSWKHIYYFWLKCIIVLSVWNKEWQTDDNSFILPCSLPGWKPSLIKKAVERCTNSDGKCCWCKQSVWSKNIKQC